MLPNMSFIIILKRVIKLGTRYTAVVEMCPQSLVLLCPLLLQGWSSHTMRQWAMLPTRQGRENHLQKQVSQKRRGQQSLLQQVLPILGLPGVGLICSCFSLLCPLQSPHRYMFLTLYTRSGTVSNDPLPVQVVYPAPLLRDIGCPEVIEQTVHTPRKKCAIKKKAYTKEGSSCSTQPIQPSFKYQKQEATSAWIKCDSSVLFWEYFYEFLLACAVLMVWRNYFFCYDVSCHGHVL